MTEEARNLISESLDKICIVNLSNGRVLSVSHDAADTQIKAAVSFFENILKDVTADSENLENIEIQIPFEPSKEYVQIDNRRN